MRQLQQSEGLKDVGLGGVVTERGDGPMQHPPRAEITLSLLTEASVEATMPGWSLDTTSSPPLGRLTICA